MKIKAERFNDRRHSEPQTVIDDLLEHQRQQGREIRAQVEAFDRIAKLIAAGKVQEARRLAIKATTAPGLTERFEPWRKRQTA